MEQCEWLHFLRSRRGTALESAGRSRDGHLVPPSDPGQPRLGQYTPASGGSGRGEMETGDEARRLAGINASLLSAREPVWALYARYDGAHSFVPNYHCMRSYDI